MKLHMHPASITSRPVRLLIAEKGLDVEEVVVDLMTGAHHQEPFVSFNPNRLVPVLEDGDLRLTDHWLGDGRKWLAGDQITIADYLAGSIVALGEMIRYDISKYARVRAWLDRVKALEHWNEVSTALDGFAASLKDREFVV